MSKTGIYYLLIVLSFSLNLNGSESKKSQKEAKNIFSEIGYFVDIHSFFKEAKISKGSIPQQKKSLSAYKAFVSKKGIYSFLETTQNDQFLSLATEGQAYLLKGKVFEKGKLVEIISISKNKDVEGLDLKKLQNSKGTKFHLEGVNKCQCGLKVGSLAHNCKLGHLHHVQSSNGKIYHYLQNETARNKYLGKNKSHFGPIKEDVLLFEGQYLLLK